MYLGPEMFMDIAVDHVFLLLNFTLFPISGSHIECSYQDESSCLFSLPYLRISNI